MIVKQRPLLIFDKVRACFINDTHETIAKNSCRKAIKRRTQMHVIMNKRETSSNHVISFHQNN